MKKTIEEVRDWLLENRVNEYGNLDLAGLDFSDFCGDVTIDGMKVKGSLSQDGHNVKWNLYQSCHEVEGNLYQSHHNIQGDLYQSGHDVQRNLYQTDHDVQGNYFSTRIAVGGDINFDEPTKQLKKITLNELKEMGYELAEDYENE